MIRKIFRQMLVTQILSGMTVMLCMLVDSIMIGRFLGVYSMTAYGLVNPILLVFAAFGTMLSAGIQVMCGKTMGAGDKEGTNACFSAAALLALTVAVTGTALILLFLTPVCTLLGAGRPGPDNAVFSLTRDYLLGFILGAPAFITAQIMVPFLQISGRRLRLVLAVVLMTVSDIIFDLLNVFVIRGGTLGMGLASSLSYYLALAVALPYFFRKDCFFRLKLKAVTGKVCAALVKYGVPTVINALAMVVLVFTLNKVLLSVDGNRAVASYSVISTVGNICYCFGSGVASVALMLASIFYSEEDRTAIHTLVRTMSYFAIALDSVVTVVVLLLAPALVSLFLKDLSAKTMTVRGLRLFAFSLLPSSLNTSFKNYYQGVNRTQFTEIISVLQNMFFPGLAALLLSRFFGTDGVWLCFFCGEALTFLVICAVVWRKNEKASLSAEASALLPRDFGVQTDDILEMTVRSTEEVSEASKKAAAFCRAHGESDRNSTFVSLCGEEMVNNIVTHGFREDRKDQNVDIRILFKGDEKIIRIRDNCVNFDPVEYMKLHEADDPVAHIGIRMVMKMVKSANYVNSLGLNNLTLVL